MDKLNGRIATFYSYKGGTGRSMALANFAWLMAASGKRVLAIDWDLEAPGLHRYFRPFLVDPDLAETDGLIDAFWNLTASAAAMTTNSRNQIAPDAAETLDDASRRLDNRFFSSGGYIDFIGAGRQDGGYSERVNSFDWKRFYELGGARLLTAAKDRLRERYHWVLIDSRTGVSDTSGICTIQMPDTVVAYFTLNRQSVDGVAAILRSIRAFRSASVDGSAINLFPIATRIENAEQGRLEVARGYARAALADFLPKAMQLHSREYWDTMEISYRPAYAFEEVLAAFGDATGATGAADTMLSQVEATAQRITGDDTLRMPEIVESDRAKVLAEYAFGVLPTDVKTAYTQDDTADTDFLRNVRAKEQLWRAAGFWWRRLLSRRELDLLTEEDRKGFGRNMAFYLVQSERMQRLLRTVEIGGPAILLSAAAASAAFFFFYGSKIVPRFEQMIWTIGSFYVVWMLSTLLWAAIGLRDKPYGIRLSDVLSLLIRGPFRRDIRDYNPDEKPTLPSP